MSDLEKLLADHQAIIDAWYAEWRAEQKARIDAVFARRLREARDGGAS